MIENFQDLNDINQVIAWLNAFECILNHIDMNKTSEEFLDFSN